MGRGLRMSVCRLPQCGRARSIEGAISVRSGKHLRMAFARLRSNTPTPESARLVTARPTIPEPVRTEHRRSYEVAVAAFSAVSKV